MAKKQKTNMPLSSSELRSLAEERLEHKQLSTGVSTISSPEEMLCMVHELEVHQVELEMQQEELARTRVELEETLGNYTELYEFAPVGYLILGRDSTVQQANLTATKLLGVERSLLLGMQFKKFAVHEGYQLIDALLESVFTKRVPDNCEVKLQVSDHSVRSFRIEAAVSDTEYA